MYYYKRVKDSKITNVEAKSIDATSPNFVKATKAEYDEFIASLPVVKPEPPISTHISIIDAINTDETKPVRIKRVWEGRDYFYDCLVTQSIKDQFIAGDIVVGDYVIVHFDDREEQIVMEKVFKSW